MLVWSLSWEDSLEGDMATHCNILAWRIPWPEEPGRLQLIRLHRVRDDWSNLAYTYPPTTNNLQDSQEYSMGERIVSSINDVGKLDACVLSCFSCVWLFVILWTIVCLAPLSTGFSRQEYWSGLTWPPPGYLPSPGIKPASLSLLHWQASSLPLLLPGKPRKLGNLMQKNEVGFVSYTSPKINLK